MSSITFIATALISIILQCSSARSLPLPLHRSQRHVSSLQLGDGIINFPDAVYFLETKQPIPRSDVGVVIKWAEDKKQPIRIGERIVVRYRVVNISVRSARPFAWYEYTIRLVPTVDTDSLEVLLRHNTDRPSYLHTLVSFVDDYPVVLHNLYYPGKEVPSRINPETATVKWTTESTKQTTPLAPRDTEPTTTIKPFDTTTQETGADIDESTTNISTTPSDVEEKTEPPVEEDAEVLPTTTENPGTEETTTLLTSPAPISTVSSTPTSSPAPDDDENPKSTTQLSEVATESPSTAILTTTTEIPTDSDTTTAENEPSTTEPDAR